VPTESTTREDEQLQDEDSQFDPSDPLVAAVVDPVMGIQVIGRFPTKAEACSAEDEHCERDAEHRRQYRERCQRENARRTAEFAERIRARRLEAERRIRGSRPAAVTYHRHEVGGARPREHRSVPRRTTSGSRDGPLPLGDDGEGDPPGSPELSLSSTYGVGQ
jgi:hypothetical protein